MKLLIALHGKVGYLGTVPVAFAMIELAILATAELSIHRDITDLAYY